MATPAAVLNTGAKIPLVGFGTWKAEPGRVGEAVRTALEVGYRHIDCAAVYGNEKEIGQVFKDVFSSGKIKRSDVFITSKLWNTCHKKEHVIEACKQTLKDLQLDYLDLYLIVSLSFLCICCVLSLCSTGLVPLSLLVYR